MPLLSIVLLVLVILFFALALTSKQRGDFILNFVVLTMVTFLVLQIGSEEYKSLTELKTGNTYKVLSVAECSENSFCFILKSQEDEQEENYYRSEETNVDKTIEQGDTVVYTNDNKLKVIDKGNPVSDSDDK